MSPEVLDALDDQAALLALHRLMLRVHKIDMNCQLLLAAVCLRTSVTRHTHHRLCFRQPLSDAVLACMFQLQVIVNTVVILQVDVAHRAQLVLLTLVIWPLSPLGAFVDVTI